MTHKPSPPPAADAEPVFTLTVDPLAADADRPAASGSPPVSELYRLRRGHLTLQTVVWVTLMLLLAVIWVHNGKLLHEEHERTRQDAERDLANLSRVCEEHAERTLRSADQVIKFVRERYLKEGRQLDLRALTEQGVIDARNFNQVGVIDEHGLYILSNLPLTGHMDLSDREHFRVHIPADTGQLFVSKPVTGRASGKVSVQLSRRITRPDGSFGGVVVVSMDPHYFATFYRDLRLGRQGLAALYGVDGIARARRSGEQLDFGTDASGSATFQRFATGQASGVAVVRSVVDQVERIYSYRRMAGLPLMLVVAVALDDVYASYRETRDALVVQGLITTALVLVLGAVLSRHLRTQHRAALGRLQADAALRQRTAQLQTLFGHSPDGYVIFDRTGRVAFTNRAFCRLVGPTAGACVGLDQAAFLAWFGALCHGGAGVASLDELTPARQAAQRRPHTVSMAASGEHVLQAAVFDNEVGPDDVSRILHLRDVTRETELDQIKSEFLSTAAHELRTPMASILGFSEVLVHHPVSEAERSEFLGIILNQSRNLTRILDELLDLARMEARRGKDFKLQPVDLHALLHEVARSLKPPAGREPPVLQLSPRVARVVADAGKLRQAVLNVLSNAYKYSPGGGAVTLELLAEARDGHVLAGIRVSDQGIGMTPEQVRHVCERFYRADKSGQTPGTGLGMSIVKEIVELHDGTLAIDSVPGRGTRVDLWLPSRLPVQALTTTAATLETL